jgi:hypothetical protein
MLALRVTKHWPMMASRVVDEYIHSFTSLSLYPRRPLGRTLGGSQIRSEIP